MQYVVCSGQLCSVQSAVCSVQSAVCSVQYVVCSVQYVVCSVQLCRCLLLQVFGADRKPFHKNCIGCQVLPNSQQTVETIVYIVCLTVQCTVYSVQHTVYCTLYTEQSTLYTLHCTLYTLHCTLYTVHCTQPSPGVGLPQPADSQEPEEEQLRPVRQVAQHSVPKYNWLLTKNICNWAYPI